MKAFVLNRMPLLVSGAALLLALVLLLAVGPTGAPGPVAAQYFPGLPNDGRINVVAHFGGDAIYCVDRNNMPTYQYSDSGQGGIRLLSENGNQLWFVPASDIAPKVELAKANPGPGVFIAQGQGTYGVTTLYVYIDATGNVKFQFTGYDEWGKTNTLEWTFCQPVGPIPSPGTHSGSSCDASTVQKLLDHAGGGNDVEEIYFTTCAQDICPNVGSPLDLEICICEANGGSEQSCVAS